MNENTDKLNDVELKVIEVGASNEGLKNLFEELEKRPELSDAFKKVNSPEEAYELAISISSGYSFEEYRSAMAMIFDAVKTTIRQDMVELTDEDLEGVSGGVDLTQIFSARGSSAANMAYYGIAVAANASK